MMFNRFFILLAFAAVVRSALGCGETERSKRAETTTINHGVIACENQ